MSFRTFDEVISYMDNENRPLGRNVRDDRLDRMRFFMELLGNPQNSYKTLHVAGSKGKGSTSSYLASAIHSLGYKTGLYLSPHVSDYRERFTVDGQFASDEDLIKTGNFVEEKLRDYNPTTFELYTAFAFQLFKQVGCQWAVIETGLGGRLDATNVLHPDASILTPIELEHTDILGDTIKLIAIEKSKIIKKDTPCFISLQKPEAMDVFEKEAKEQNAEITELKNEIVSLTTKSTIKHQILNLELKDGYKVSLNLKMIGDVQAYNCALAICTLRKLGLYKQGITEKALENNLIPGRMEHIVWDRNIYLDGAHTENSMCHLVKSFKSIYPEDDAVCIFGCLSGKNETAMSRIILDNFKTVIISKPGNYKKSDPRELFNLFNSTKSDSQKIYLIEDTKEALDFCKKITDCKTPILICGSFYLAGSVKEALCL